MRISIGCVDGNTYHSVEMDVESMNEDIANSDGKVFTGTYSHRQAKDFEELWVFIEEMLTYNTAHTHQTFTMDTYKYGMMTFNVKHIVWWSRTE